jgi:hypothetical protein
MAFQSSFAVLGNESWGSSTASMMRETNNRMGRAMGALALAVTLVLVPIKGETVEGDTVTLVTPLAYGTYLPGLGKPALTLARTLKERSGGTLVLDLKQPGDGTLP